MALAEQHIETQGGNAQHYERELFVRTDGNQYARMRYATSRPVRPA